MNKGAKKSISFADCPTEFNLMSNDFGERKKTDTSITTFPYTLTLVKISLFVKTQFRESVLRVDSIGAATLPQLYLNTYFIFVKSY